jgi:Predicted membrane protein involved in D-alanine export
MSLISFEFLIFICITAAAYQVCTKKYRWIVLMFASVIFVCCAQSILLTLLMALQITVTYAAGVAIARSRERQLIVSGKTIMLLAVLFNIGAMIALKDINFFIRPLILLLKSCGIATGVHVVHADAPMGISYYSLIMISYILDVYWNVTNAQKNAGRMILFSAFFPVLTSGPFIRYRDIESSMYAGNRITYLNLTQGLQRVLWGMFKSMVISGRIGTIVDTVYANPASFLGFYQFIAYMAFVIQLYTNFSGCIDIIMGICQIFGIEMPENFNSPFFSTSIAEFWRRWHVTLGLWLKDYVLYPLLKSKAFRKIGKTAKAKYGKKWGKQAPLFTGLMISWFLIGFWHGGSWNYIWGCGIYYGILIIMGQLLEPQFVKINSRLKINRDSRGWKTFQRIRTFIIFSWGLSFFRSYDGLIAGIRRWGYALSTFNPQIIFNGSLLKLGLEPTDVALLVVSLVILLVVDTLQFKKPVIERLSELSLPARWTILLALLFFVIIFGQYGTAYNAASFIYEKF